MVKSKSSCLAKLPKDQRCQFLLGPISSWFMPNISDVWTKPTQCENNEKEEPKSSQDDNDMIYDLVVDEGQIENNLSYFIYGSIGCFCYGEIHYDTKRNRNLENISRLQSEHIPPITAIVNRLIDVREDNSRVSCVRFLKTSQHPVAMILTENGSFMIHNCISSDNLIHFKKSELMNKLIPEVITQQDESERSNKKARYNVTQQINSFVWPNAENIFLGLSMLKEKTNFLYWLKVKDLINRPTGDDQIAKSDFIESYEQVSLNLPRYPSPICCMESIMLDTERCLISVAMDDGLITVVSINLVSAQVKKTIQLARHNDQISSMSFWGGNTLKFPLGLLASASRDGLVLVWDVENEFYFADYQASFANRRANSIINWFALTFIDSKTSKHTHLAVSNCDSGLTVLELPENAKSKIRLKDNRESSGKKQPANYEQTLRHHALIFNVVFNTTSGTIMTSSLDGNHILWQENPSSVINTKDKKDLSLDIEPKYMFTSMPNNTRTHMLRFNPIKENVLAMALGKSGVRFYKFGQTLSSHRFDMSQSTSLICRKITKDNLCPTSICWHPSHEYRIAIGTLEGKVLRMDITPRRSTVVEAEYKPLNSERSADQPPDDLFGVDYKPLERDYSDPKLGHNHNENADNYSGKTDGIYSLCWGPNPASPEDLSKSAIYAIGSISHRLFVYCNMRENGDKLNDYLDEFHDQSLPESKCEASEVAWKSSMDLMALGTTKGTIIIVSYLDEAHVGRSRNRLFKKLAVIEGPLGTSYIQCLVWHPTTDKDDSCYHYIAASSNESPAFVFDLTESILVTDVKAKLKVEDQGDVVNNSPTNGDIRVPSILSTYVSKLEAHKKPISDIAWNPHKPDELATSSFDRISYVWCIDSGSSTARILSKFAARDRLFTLEWSLVDDDMILISGHDSVVWAWRPSENLMRNEVSSV